MKPHKHAEVIKAWADGATIEYRNEISHPCWTDMPICSPNWHEDFEYRVKPEPKPDIVEFFYAEQHSLLNIRFSQYHGVQKPKLMVTFDGETGKLKSAEVI